VLLAACGGQGASSDAGPADVFRAFARAAGEQDGDRLWDLISERMKAQISRDEFTAPSVLQNLRDDYAPVADGSVVLDVELEDELSLVALAGDAGSRAQAAILRLEEGNWRVQLTELDLGFGSGDREFTVNARSQDRDSIEVRAWVDGREALVERGKDTYAPTFEVRSARKLGGRPHTVVAYVEAGERSGAIAWTLEG
jgi:hypothetical protein